MGYSVTKSPAVMVPPSSPTPLEKLPLSSIDQTAAVRVLVDLIFVFEQGAANAGDVIRRALARALVDYYPVAGKVVENGSGELEVECTGEGVWFVEAAMDCELRDVKKLELPIMVDKKELLPCPPDSVNMEDCAFMMQVTQFNCQGFTVGIRFNHSVFDGLGCAQLIKAIGDIARGLDHPIVHPIWCRESIPTPAKSSHPPGPPPSFDTFIFETSIHDISHDTINQIKNLYVKETGHRCSTFDVITAILWQCRTRAINTSSSRARRQKHTKVESRGPKATTWVCTTPEHDNSEVRLGFAANVRHLLQQVLPKGRGYYGNCVYPMSVVASSAAVTNGTLVEVISLIRRAKEAMPTRFLDWLVGGLKDDPYKVPLDYYTCVVSDWTRVGFNDVDFGWGQPIHVAPLNDDTNFVASCIFLKEAMPAQGVRLLTRCVVEEDQRAFDEEIMKLLENYPPISSENKSYDVSS